MNYISLMLLLPLLAAILLTFIKNEKFIKLISFFSSIVVLIISILMYKNFNFDLNFNFVEEKLWIEYFNIKYYVGVDYLSMLMILLTNVIMPLAILSSFSYIKKNIKKYYIWLLILHTSMLGTFASLDVFLFYIFWEAMLIPMYFIIGIWGGENRKYATVKFFIYTMALSLVMFAGILITYFDLKKGGINSFSIFDFYRHNLLGKTQLFVFLSFLIAFAVKIPLFPFHSWLPDAHVEAPTAGSVILAGILLKMGVYGYLRFLIPMFPELSLKFAPYMIFIGAFGIIYASLMALVQKDIKKMVAYSSIAHMGLIVAGVFSFNNIAFSGSILQMINHGISTGGLFLMIGVLYERTHTRLIEDYGGIFKIVPFISTFFMIISLSSIAVPSTNGFIGEITILIGLFKKFHLYAIISVSGIILSAVYMLSAYEKIFFGEIKNKNLSSLLDLNIREWLYLLPIILLIFWIGIYPSFILSKLDSFSLKFLSTLLKGV